MPKKEENGKKSKLFIPKQRKKLKSARIKRVVGK